MNWKKKNISCYSEICHHFGQDGNIRIFVHLGTSANLLVPFCVLPEVRHIERLAAVIIITITTLLQPE